MYDFDEDLVDKAIVLYTRTHCYGELDEDFYLNTWYACYGDPALEACIVMDYIDEVCGPIYQENIQDLAVGARNRHQKSLDFGDGPPMGC